MTSSALRYSVAFALALAAVVAVGMGLGTLPLRLPGTTVPAVYALAPLTGLALFQILFGLLDRRWRGPGFWAVALPLTAVLVALTLTLVLTRALPPAGAGGLAAVALYLFGLWTLRLPQRGGA